MCVCEISVSLLSLFSVMTIILNKPFHKYPPGRNCKNCFRKILQLPSNH